MRLKYMLVMLLVEAMTVMVLFWKLLLKMQVNFWKETMKGGMMHPIKVNSLEITEKIGTDGGIKSIVEMKLLET